MAYPNGGNGSGSSSSVSSAKYRLGPEQNIFESDTLENAEESRNEYGQNDSAWLAEYADNNYYLLLVYSDSDGDQYAVAEFLYTDSDGSQVWTQLQSIVAVAGDDAPDVIMEYSEDGGDEGWHTTYAATDNYLRLSTDDGETYTEAMKFIGDDAPDVIYQYAPNDDSDADWSDTFTSNYDYYMRISTDNGVTWSDAYRFVGESVIMQYSTSGTANWHTTMTDSDRYWRWSVDGGDTWSDDSVQFRNDTSGLPSPYYTYISSDGKLVIANETEELDLFELDENGLWVINSVTTGTGSFHLADIMSIGAGGSEVSFVNELTGIAKYPSSGAVNMSTYAHEAVMDRVHEDVVTTLLSGTSYDSSTTLNCAYSVTAPSSSAYVSVAYVLAEDYDGEIVQYAYDSATGDELTRFSRDVSASAGDLVRLGFDYPFWVDAGYEFYVRTYDEDGNYLKVYAGNEDSTVPYRSVMSLSYEDYLSYNASNINELVSTYNDTFIDSDGDGTGFDFDTLTNVPIASDSEQGIIKIDEKTISLDSDGTAYVNPDYIDITDLGNASSYLSAALQGTFDENAVETDFTYAGFSATSEGTYTSVGMFWKYAPSSGDLTVTLGGNEYEAGDILLCIESIDDTITLTSSNFETYFSYIPDADNLATDTVAGSIMLTNDLGGTATSPTVEHVDGENVEYIDETTSESVYLAVVDSKLYLVIDDGATSDSDG